MSKKWSFDFNIINQPTSKVISNCYIVITGYSNIAYEAYFFNVYSVRMVPISIFPPRESNGFSIDFNDAHEFNKWFLKNKDKIYSRKRLTDMRKMAFYYYYKNDGNAHKRLFNFLKRNNKLPHNSN